MESQYRVTEAQKNAFWRDGHILLRRLADKAEIEKYAPAIREAGYKYAQEKRPLEDRDTYHRAFLQITNLWRHDETVREFVFHKKFAQAAADLLGVERIRLYHDQALFKEPGGGFTPWHQDQYYWPLDTDKCITMWMPLSNITAEMGPVKFASGSHRRGPIGSLEISDESEAAYEQYILQNGSETAKADFMEAGDATFHLGWTVHGADSNLSRDKPREAMTIIYFGDGARISSLSNKNQKNDLDAWLDGKAEGEIADGPLNPVVN